ncbi:SMI1/KNR4 family protein [Paenibacillus sp. NPDC057886]|uniref:SMI1/KNR4 family protein n=1 Tax=Paenibacillus sp. NPDC057886 TaxID=3346270 RepID=UPI00367EBCEE
MNNGNKYLGGNNIDSFLMFLKENYSSNLKACDANDMMQIKQIAEGRKLPEAYLKFMECAGRGYIMFKGSDYTIKDIEIYIELKEGAVEVLEECNFKNRIGDDQFVFMGHQGYMYWFFDLNDGSNPPVYFFEESYDESVTQGEFIKLSDSFSEFLIKKYNGELQRY